MHGIENEHKLLSNHALNDGQEVAFPLEKMCEADAHSPKRWATGRATSSNQWTLGHDVMARCIQQRYIADNVSSRRDEMDRSLDS